MRLDDVYIAGTGCWVPSVMTMEEAEREGLCERRLVWATGITSVSVAAESAPEMAARAARAALGQAGVQPGDVALLLHAHASYQGHDMWPAALYVQRCALGNRCPAMEVSQMSSGGMAALDLAASYLVASKEERQLALVTTGDRFSLPWYDRWRSDPGTICGDGGTAAVLSGTRGHVRVHSVVSVSDPGLELIGRGDDPFGDAPLSARAPIDLEAHRGALVREIGLDALLERMEAGQAEAVDQALGDAKLRLADIDWFVLPTFGRNRMKAHFLRPLGIDANQTNWPWGRTVGHLGAGDQIAGLHHLVETGDMRPGQFGVLLGVGAGFTWGAAVVELLTRPEAGVVS